MPDHRVNVTHLGRLKEATDLVWSTWSWAEKGVKWARDRSSYAVTVSSEDRIYHPLVRRLVDEVPAEEMRKVSLVTHRHHDPSSDSPTDRLVLEYGGTSRRRLRLGGVPVSVEFDDGSARPIDDGGDVPADAPRAFSIPRPAVVTLSCRTADDRTRLVRWMASLIETKRSPEFYMTGRWSGWERRPDLPTRRLDDVSLKGGQVEQVRDDLRAFLNSRERYERLGVPWHRGYLFYGPPGCGKSTLAQALGSHFGLDVYYASLSSMSEDQRVLDLIAAVRPGSLVLLEDVDVLRAARDRDADSDKAVSTAALLNGLDGVATPHGVVFVLTTNRRDVLDAALVRACRVDVELELTTLDYDQASALLDRIYQTEGHSLDPSWFVGRSPAEVVSVAVLAPDEPWTLVDRLKIDTELF